MSGYPHGLPSTKFKSLRSAFATAVAAVLDKSFRKRGYEVSKTELGTAVPEPQDKTTTKQDANNERRGAKVASTRTLSTPSITSQQAFDARRQRILALLGAVSPKASSQQSQSQAPRERDNNNNNNNNDSLSRRTATQRSVALPTKSMDEGIPFTLQRLAEVLVDPHRYYTQTHKICNCVEKLLLVKASINAFGGNTGGETSQTKREVSARGKSGSSVCKT